VHSVYASLKYMHFTMQDMVPFRKSSHNYGGIYTHEYAISWIMEYLSRPLDSQYTTLKK